MDPSPDPGFEIRPLRKGTSRIFLTVALVVALALAIYASSKIVTLRNDPEVRTRVEAFERMKAEARSDSTGLRDLRPDSTSLETAVDSL
jgi:hypothetical protein